MSQSHFTEESLRRYLTMACKCIYKGKALPRPYSAEDDAPDMYVTSDGEPFSVPMPDLLTGYYSPIIIEAVFSMDGVQPVPVAVEAEYAAD